MASALTSAMDALPVMTERKKYIDMHVKVASNILNEINKRELNSLQDWEDEIMLNSDSLPTQTRTDMMRYLNREVSSKDEFTDKVRLLVILILTFNERELVDEAIKAVKKSTIESEKTATWFDSSTEKLLTTLMQSRGTF